MSEYHHGCPAGYAGPLDAYGEVGQLRSCRYCGYEYQATARQCLDFIGNNATTHQLFLVKSRAEYEASVNPSRAAALPALLAKIEAQMRGTSA